MICENGNAKIWYGENINGLLSNIGILVYSQWQYSINEITTN